MTNLEYAQSLRLLADLYESKPDLPQPYDSGMIEFIVQSKEQVAAVFRGFGGSFRKEYDNDTFRAFGEIGSLKIKIFGNRNRVCKKVVIKEAQPEIAEWVCDEPILA